MQSVKGAQIINITFLLILFAAPPTAAVFETGIVPLPSMYESLWKFYEGFMEVLNLMLLLSYLPLDASFTSTQFLVLNLDDTTSYSFIIFLYSIIILYYYYYHYYYYYYYYINLSLILHHQ